MSDSSIDPAGRQRFGLWLAGSLLVIAGAVSYLTMGDRWTISSRPDESASATSVALPEDVVLPPGPHRGEFQTSCVICHSPRLAFSQPTFAQEKWAEIVHKMVAAYGAPITKDDEQRIVAYMMAVQTVR